MAQQDSSSSTLKSRSSLNSSWGIMMLQPKLLNNVVFQDSQEVTPCTAKHVLAKATPFSAFVPDIWKCCCCLGCGSVWCVIFIGILQALFYLYSIFYHLWQMVTCLKFLNNILAAEFQIKSKLSKSEKRVSLVIFYKVDWWIFFFSCTCKFACMWASRFIHIFPWKYFSPINLCAYRLQQLNTWKVNLSFRAEIVTGYFIIEEEILYSSEHFLNQIQILNQDLE